MLEQQFIQWSDTIPPIHHELPLPVCDNIELRFFANSNPNYDEVRLYLVHTNGDIITDDFEYHRRYITIKENGVLRDFVWFSLDSLYPHLAPNECFRLAVYASRDEAIVERQYSNLLRFVTNEGDYLSELHYSCHENQFGFPFWDYSGAEEYDVSLALPIRLSKPQYNQNDKIYETRNGEQIVLYSSLQKEYEGETDYIPETWHEKIITALSCDEVSIGGMRVVKSAQYEIDHDNYTFSDCGQRLTRATFKAKTNILQRNTNC